MAKYFFPLVGGASLPDDSGMDFPTRTAAVEHATRIARGVAKGTPNYVGASRFVAVVDEGGEEIFRMAVKAFN
ncbi:DUF6894 family protein [Tardiphaga sp. 768_D3_N2_1]|uniref:DUF6894 family protein n=1 Tax=Tardiphaga sp. 768_D3_N2_1 TaxID=3240783 RepID=UPI003F8937F8